MRPRAGSGVAVLAVLMFLVGVLHSAEFSVPAKVQSKKGFVTLKAKTDGKVVKWVALDPKISLFPSEQLADKTGTVVLAPEVGTYRILAYTAWGDTPSEPAIVTLTIVGDDPGPGPGPGPGPSPGPTPDADTLKALQSAYSSDPDPNKKANTAQLAGMYRAASEASVLAEIKDGFGLDAKLMETAKILKLSGTVQKVQAEVGVQLRKRYTLVKKQELTADLRAIISRSFSEIALALESIR